MAGLLVGETVKGLLVTSEARRLKVKARQDINHWKCH
jgi:hypothetical protein